jgi:hypothetical protein
MLIPIITTVAIAALTCWLGYLAVRYLLPHLPNPMQARKAARDRIVSDPLDYVRAWIVRIAPSRLKLQQQMQATQAKLNRATEREQHIMTSFKDGKEPTFGFKVTAITLFVLWIVAIVSAFLIDVPIINSVSGGNVLFGVLGTLLLLGMPIIGSVLLGHFFGKWRAGKMAPIWFSVAVTVILAVVVSIVAILTSLAPIRAEVEYADKIRTVQQQLTMYKEDGDQNAILYAEQNLKDLQAQQQRSAEWNQALVPIAATAEFATGFFFPLALPLLLLVDAQASRRKSEASLAASANALTNQRARQYARLSARFQRLGLAQLALQQHLATVNAENTGDAAPATAIGDARGQVAEELLAQAPSARSQAEAPLTATDEAITAEIVTTGEHPPVVPAPREATPRRGAAPATQQATMPSAPVALLERDIDLPDDSFDLS